jgi:hypothetical protein
MTTDNRISNYMVNDYEKKFWQHWLLTDKQNVQTLLCFKSQKIPFWNIFCTLAFCFLMVILYVTFVRNFIKKSPYIDSLYKFVMEEDKIINFSQVLFSSSD